MSVNDLKSFNVNFLEKSDVLNKFLSDIRQYPLLTEDEEVELVEQIKNGDEKAREKLINSNLRFVFSIAKLYRTDSTVLDLVNEGVMGLICAIDKFDPTRGIRFLSYAVWYIRRAIKTYLMNNKSLVKRTNLPILNNKLNIIKNYYYCENGRFPCNEEIIDILEKDYGIKIKEEADVYDITTDYLSSTYDDGKDTVVMENTSLYNNKTCSYNDYNIEMDHEYFNSLAEKVLTLFSTRDRKIIEMYYGIGAYKGAQYENMEDIADEVGVCRERVRQIIEKGKETIRKSKKYILSENN